MTVTESARRPFTYLAFTLFFAGLLLIAFSSVRLPVVLTPQLLLLLVATLLAENFALSMPGYGVSLTYPLLVALAVVCGPTAALIGALLSAVNYEELRMRLPASVHAFNIGQLLISNGLAAWAYVLLGGRVLTDSFGAVSPIQLTDFPGIILPIAAMAIVGAFGNVALIGFGYSLKQGIGLGEAYSAIGWLPPVQIALAGVGVLLAQVIAASVLALPLFIFPLFVARQFYQRFMALQSAYTETIRSLVTGLEAKDPYTRGHSERVAEYSVLLARARGLDEKSIREIEATALLHDLGKLTVGGAVLRKNGKLDDEEWKRMKSHPEIGASMVARIPPLRGFSDAVSKHHERLDGSGYPAGISGDEIPLTARILAIADSYDAMTTDRPYRPGMTREAAVEELHACSGRLYDPELVDAFVAALHGPEQSLPAGGIRGAIGAGTERVDAT